MNYGPHPIYQLHGMQSSALETGKGAWISTQLDDAFWQPGFSVVDLETYRLPNSYDTLLQLSMRERIELGALSVGAGYEAAG